MVRSAAAVLAVLILPSFAQAQEPVGTHTVVDEDTLWDLAQLYYQNPFEWRVIWEANRDSISDPNMIFPAETFIIPGLPGTAATAETPVQADSGMTTVGLPEAEPEVIEAVGADGADRLPSGETRAAGPLGLLSGYFGSWRADRG